MYFVNASCKEINAHMHGMLLFIANLKNVLKTSRVRNALI